VAGEIKWTQSAWADLEEAADYIAKDSEYYAKAFVSEINEAVKSLYKFFERGRIVPEFNDKSIRELFVRNFRLIYKLDNNTVYITGLIHGARNLWKIWDADERKISES